MRRDTTMIFAVLVIGYSLYLPPVLALTDAVNDRNVPTNETMQLTPSTGNGNTTGVGIRFKEVSAKVGPDYRYERKFEAQMSVMSNAGIYAADYDNDGWEDLFAIGSGRPVLFHNDRGTFHRTGEFHDVNITVRGALFLDYDSDGWEDLLLLAANHTPVLLENSEGSFKRVDAGFEKPLDMPIGATVGDFDGDGNLDLFVIQYGDWFDRRPIGLKNYSIPRGEDNGNPNYLYDGNGETFERVKDVGIDSRHWSLATSFVDLDGDDHIDIHVANDFYYDMIYLNQGDGTFQKHRLGTRTNRNGMSSEIADINRDGHPDIFVTNIWFPNVIGKDLTDVAKLRYEGNNLLINQGGGTFAYQSTKYGVRKGGWGWAAVIADLDNDMDRDLFHTTSWIPFQQSNTDFTLDQILRFQIKYPYYRYPILAERNDTGFVRPFYTPRTGLVKGDTRGVARLDYDNDGDLDLVVSNASAHGVYRTLENQADQGNAVQLQVVGPNGESALGATVRVTIGTHVRYRWVIARSDFLSQDSRLLHVGVGNNTRIDVTITWPDGTSRTIENIAVSQRIVVSSNGVQHRSDFRDDAP